MPLKTSSGPLPKVSQPPKPSISSASEMLTPSEIESLRRGSSEAIAYGLKVFSQNKPAKTPKTAA